ncbi:unnamed protein product [Bursaphelenchus okinawaensis]|uniref:Uncharacterized protein n=1 Tax=Bursaphelenchus okinawaensis TaxID=465554 RepID=A0A811L6X2_9BILA|nr:unnamed protein product [Bursaphelenchus okinawaensis]CAG9118999.1 unnamed protein product [Bursaphelenchus okinawaensis]
MKFTLFVLLITVAITVAQDYECDFFLDTIEECNGVYRKADSYDLELNAQFENDMRLYYIARNSGLPAVRPKFPNFCREKCYGNGLDDFRRRLFRRRY